MSEAPASQGETNLRVSTLELFFDLVFVFIITQVTHLVAHPHDALDFAKAALILGVTWWMYGGYAWLTNNVSTGRTLNRFLLLLGMGSFLMVAISVPKAFDGGGFLFGVAYLLITCIHAFLFTRAQSAASARAIFSIAPFNLISAALVLLAGFVHAEWDWWLWGGAFLIQVLSPIIGRVRGFSVSSAHFVERHGLVMIIALGESIVTLGTGASEETLSANLILKVLLGLMLTAALWWSYFETDDPRAEAAMESVEGPARSVMAVRAYGYAHYIMLLGVIFSAGGLNNFLSHKEEHALIEPGMLLALGLFIYLLGDVLFRFWLGIDRLKFRFVFAVLALALGFVLQHVGNLVQLSGFTLLLVLMLVLESKLQKAEG
ncbi:low temperature requirement protein A [Deinococcus roseus]|uniref:Low temperature requirement protein A n=1 Tax=Deinococcus roseus TaxID=392414 RepID=A0ABQ2CT58_9DEIO|nr:low temperature requirement protein A [Deinococcus roseus]